MEICLCLPLGPFALSTDNLDCVCVCIWASLTCHLQATALSTFTSCSLFPPQLAALPALQSPDEAMVASFTLLSPLTGAAGRVSALSAVLPTALQFA